MCQRGEARVCRGQWTEGMVTAYMISFFQLVNPRPGAKIAVDLGGRAIPSLFGHPSDAGTGKPSFSEWPDGMAPPEESPRLRQAFLSASDEDLKRTDHPQPAAETLIIHPLSVAEDWGQAQCLGTTFQRWERRFRVNVIYMK